MQRLALPLAVLMIANANAAGLYKCTDATGQVTYSQTQCVGATEQAVRVSASKPSSGPSNAALAQQCLRDGNFKDPDSVQLIEVGKMGAEVVTHAASNTPIIAKRLSIKVNAKNGYGGYTGAEWYYCYISLSDNSVFSVSKQ